MTEQVKIEQAFVVDGKVFHSKKEANAYLRRPKVKSALEAFISNEPVVDWLLQNEEGVSEAFEVGKIRRVTNTERNQLRKSLDAIVENGDRSFEFVIKNADAIHESFRHPSVKRMDDAEQAQEQMAALTALAEGNEKVAQFVMENKERILESYQAGVQKRKVSPKALEALAKYREEAKKAKEEAAAE